MNKEEALVLIEKKRDVLKKERDNVIYHLQSEDRYKQLELSALDKGIECLDWAYDLVERIEVVQRNIQHSTRKILLP